MRTPISNADMADRNFKIVVEGGIRRLDEGLDGPHEFVQIARDALREHAQRLAADASPKTKSKKGK